MVDYSKWDRMDFSDSEEDDDGPRVTSLDQPGKVTIGSDGSLEIGKSSLPMQPARTESLASSSSQRPTAQGMIPTVSGGRSGDAVDISTSRQEKERQWRSDLTHNGGECHCTVTVDGREIRLPIYWCQDRCTTTLRLGIPPAVFPTRGIRVRVEGALKYPDRFSAVGSGAMTGHGTSESDDEPSYGSVEIVSVSSDKEEETKLLTGKLPRPIHLNQDEDEIDFEIEDNLGSGNEQDGECQCTKLVAITMPKAVPMAGIVLWWDRPLVGYPQIDVSKIEGRNLLNKTTKSEAKGSGKQQSTEEKKEAFQKAWDEAHAMFREKMKSKEKQSIDIDD